MDPGSVASGFHCGSSGVDVRRSTPGEPGNDRAAYLGCNLFDGCKVAVADNGKSGLDYVDIETLELPGDLDYGAIGGLSNEVRQKLQAHKPATLGQAARISGVTPAALVALLKHVRRRNSSRAA